MTMRFAAGTLLLAAFCVAQPAVAVNLNPNGLGQVLIYPYYTVNKNQDTLISIGNASDAGKVLLVRLREGYNGREVVQFGLFLSAHDIWTASISQIADDDGAILKTNDRSCTDPIVPAEGVAFRSSGYDGTGPFPADSGPQGITRTREGYIEVIMVADVVAGSPLDATISHVQNGNPGEGVPACDATALSIGSIDPDQVVAPGTGLYGSGSIVNVGEGTFFAYNADALNGFTDFTLSLSSDGSEIGPSLLDANSQDSTLAARANIFTESGRPLSLDYEFGIDAVSAVFMADAIYNEYLVAASLGANTDWIVTFPTKRFYTDELFGNVPFAPFVEAFQDGTSDVLVVPKVYDREEGAEFPCYQWCIPSPTVLSYVVNVSSFQNIPVPTTPAAIASGVFGSLLTSLFIHPYGDGGSAVLDLSSGEPGHLLPGGIDAQGNEVYVLGLPVTGFMAYNVINTQAQPGMLANYSGAFRHRATMACLGANEGCPSTITEAAGTR